MDLHLFNQTKRHHRKQVVMAPAKEPVDSDINLMGMLDPGCEDLGEYANDVVIAPGVIAHFNTLENPPADYYRMPTFERTRLVL